MYAIFCSIVPGKFAAALFVIRGVGGIGMSGDGVLGLDYVLYESCGQAGVLG